MTQSVRVFVCLFFGSLLFLASCTTSNTKNRSGSYIEAEAVRFPPSQAQAQGKDLIITTQGKYATEAAQEIYQLGGNLIDAFVAASFVISVERPQSTGIGGGGFLIFREALSQKVYALDFRERAPQKASRDMYLDKNGHYVSHKSKVGALAAGVPGLVQGLWEAHQKFGKLSWSELLAPAIRLAENGFAVYPDLERALKEMQSELSKDVEARRIFLKSNFEIFKSGEILIQKDLAQTLKKIAKNGSKEFYTGETSKKIISHQNKMNGLISARDLTNYKVKWREPVSENFLNYKVYSMPPPSSGGIHVIQYLKMLESELWTPEQANSAQVLHIQGSVLQSAFADRATHLGDPDFYKVPQNKLLSGDYLRMRRHQIPESRARSESEVGAGVFPKESSDTTHMSLMDKQGNMISSTQTINGYMGAAVVATGTGILLNNEMDDFSAKPGTANLFGAVGEEANAIVPEKTPLSSMSPTLIIDSAQRPVMAVGAPGGTRIISCTAQTIFNYLFFKKSLWEAVTNIRYHHQWKPNILTIEKPGPSKADQEQLKKMGYNLEIGSIGCRVMAAAYDQGVFTGVADPRDIGTSWAK